MNSSLDFPLRVSATQAKSLGALQQLFADACNYLSPIARANRCWNRVALHHLAYKELRERFPQLGSQMACNVIYSVCRAARVIYQHPDSQWNVGKNPTASLPLLHFLPESPVYFDRHTLSLKDGRLSLFTLEGRMHFQLDLSAEMQKRFREERLREIALRRHGKAYVLHFHFSVASGTPGSTTIAWNELPEYLIVQSSREAESPLSSDPTPVV